MSWFMIEGFGDDDINTRRRETEQELYTGRMKVMLTQLALVIVRMSSGIPQCFLNTGDTTYSKHNSKP